MYVYVRTVSLLHIFYYRPAQNLTSSLPNAAVEKLEKDSSNLLPALRNAYNVSSDSLTTQLALSN